MKPGYVYILTNESMPGVVKIGRTERQPEVRSKELRTTGVPQPFKLEHFVFVEDCIAVEQGVHAVLDRRGLRTSSAREFFQASLTEAIDAMTLVCSDEFSSGPTFEPRYMANLAELIDTLPVPEYRAQIDSEQADALAEKIAHIARRGYPRGIQMCAEIFEVNCPSALRFKQYWLEFLDIARVEASAANIASGGRAKREIVGKEAAEYIVRCHSHGWLLERDFELVSDFLVRGDQFQYDGYISHIRRHPLPPDVMDKALAL
jgi:hypothetical protein